MQAYHEKSPSTSLLALQPPGFATPNSFLPPDLCRCSTFCQVRPLVLLCSMKSNSILKFLVKCPFLQEALPDLLSTDTHTDS